MARGKITVVEPRVFGVNFQERNLIRFLDSRLYLGENENEVQTLEEYSFEIYALFFEPHSKHEIYATGTAHVQEGWIRRIQNKKCKEISCNIMKGRFFQKV